MLRKISGIVFLIIFATILLCIPTSADAVTDYLEEYKYFEVDFTKGTAEDLMGNYVYDTLSSYALKRVPLVYDGFLGEKVLELKGDSTLIWEPKNGETFVDYELSQGITVEALVYVVAGPGVSEKMVIFETCDDAMHFVEYNEGYSHRAEFTCGDRHPCGLFKETDAYISSVFPRMEWTHLVGTSDAATTKLFVNGNMVNSIGRNKGVIASLYDTGDNMIYLGGSYWGDSFFTGRIAFLKIYKTAVNNAMGKRMYKAFTGSMPTDILVAERGMRVSEYISSVQNTDDVVFWLNGKIADENDMVCTGMKVYKTNKASNSTTIMQTAVTGDVTGDGVVGSVDYFKVKKVLSSGQNFEGAFFKAADVNNDGLVKSIDYIKIKRMFLN